MTKIAEKIDLLRTQRGWTVYRLAEVSGVSKSTIHQWFDTNTMPTIPALEQICAAFGITMSDFFREGNLVELSPEIREIVDAWCSLSAEEKMAIRAIFKSYISKN